METVWFALVAFMLGMYLVLDGFDLGAGAIHLFAARTPPEPTPMTNRSKSNSAIFTTQIEARDREMMSFAKPDPTSLQTAYL